MKILFATDLHGSQLTFSKLIRVLDLWSPDALVLGGDVAGKGLVPILVEGDRARMDWMGETIDVSLNDLDPWEERVGQVGLYPTRVTPTISVGYVSTGSSGTKCSRD